MKPKVTTCSDYVELGHGDKVPKRGVALRGALVFEDGRQIGIATPTATHAAATEVMDVRSDYVEIRYVPVHEAVKA